MPIHPVGFLVITRERVHGLPVAKQFQRLQSYGKLSFQAFGLEEDQLKVTVITPRSSRGGGVVDTCGIITTLEGQPLPAAPSPAGWASSTTSRSWKPASATDQALIEALIGLKSVQHNNYQDFDAF